MSAQFSTFTSPSGTCYLYQLDSHLCILILSWYSFKCYFPKKMLCVYFLKLKGAIFAKQNKPVKSRHHLSLKGIIEDRRRNDGQNDRCDRSWSWRALHEGKVFPRKSRCYKEFCVSSGILRSLKHSSAPGTEPKLTSGKGILRNLMVLSVRGPRMMPWGLGTYNQLLYGTNCIMEQDYI